LSSYSRSSFYSSSPLPSLPSFPTRRSSDLPNFVQPRSRLRYSINSWSLRFTPFLFAFFSFRAPQLHATLYGTRSKVCQLSLEERSEEHTSELQSRENLVCRLLLAKKKEQTM